MRLKSGALGRAAVPSGASTGEFEATELRDGGPELGRQGRRRERSRTSTTTIAKALVGARATDQVAIDETLRELDGTPNKSRLGANAILGVSLATARAAALEAEVPLYIYIAELSGLSRDQATVLPVPMMNVINGGAHADNSVDLQEFMVVPAGAPTFSDGPADGHRGLPRAEGDPEGARARDHGRRRGRLRARPRVERGGARCAGRGNRGGRLRARAPTRSSPSTRRPARSTANPTAPTCSSTRAGR